MDEKEILKERFKTAVSSTVKAISGNFDLEIKFSNKTDSKKNLLNLPDIIALKNLQDFTNLRAFADSEASYVLIFDYLRLPFSALFAYYIFFEIPSIWVFIISFIS